MSSNDSSTLLNSQNIDEYIAAMQSDLPESDIQTIQESSNEKSSLSSNSALSKDSIGSRSIHNYEDLIKNVQKVVSLFKKQMFNNFQINNLSENLKVY